MTTQSDPNCSVPIGRQIVTTQSDPNCGVPIGRQIVTTQSYLNCCVPIGRQIVTFYHKFFRSIFIQKRPLKKMKRLKISIY